MKGVTPILTALPPKETLSRGDGPHSGNPDVRSAVLERKEPQHVAWAAEREGGGRGFGFTGGHDHWNWGDAELPQGRAQRDRLVRPGRSAEEWRRVAAR